MENTKRDFSLDFTKPRHIPGGQLAPSLVTSSITPLLGLSTPELNKMISGEELAVLTPNGISSVIPQSNILPSPLIPTTVNSNNIINNANSYNNNNNNNCNSNTTNPNGNNNQNGQKRLDKHRDPDVEKIEKKRERNRLAAKKCRQRKLETIDELRKTVFDWEQKYERLEREFERFKTIKSREIDQLSIENSELKSMLR